MKLFFVFFYLNLFSSIVSMVVVLLKKTEKIVLRAYNDNVYKYRDSVKQVR